MSEVQIIPGLSYAVGSKVLIRYALVTFFIILVKPRTANFNNIYTRILRYVLIKILSIF